jgi:hypothetical protein
MGLEVSPMCDRDTISLCNMQMGFIEFVVAPLIIGKQLTYNTITAAIHNIVLFRFSYVNSFAFFSSFIFIFFFFCILLASNVTCTISTSIYSIRQHTPHPARDRRQHGQQLQPVGPAPSDGASAYSRHQAP